MIKQLTLASLLFVAFQANSQTGVKPPPYSKASLNQYLWSFSKNSLKPRVKLLIDFDVIDNWRQLEGAVQGYLSVNNDGKYFAYTSYKHTGTRYYGWGTDSLIVQSTTNNWRMAFGNANPGLFSDDGKQYIFQNGDDLWFLHLGNAQSDTIKSVSSFKTNKKGDWIAWQVKGSDSLTLRNLATGKERKFIRVSDYNFDNEDGWFVCAKNDTKELIIYKLGTNTEKYFSNVEAYSFSRNGKSLLLKTNDKSATSLQYVSLTQAHPKIIWSTLEKAVIGSYCLDDGGQQVVFSIEDSSDANKIKIWYYKAGTDKAVLKISNQTSGIPAGLTFGDASFTENGKYIQLKLQAKPLVTGESKEDLAGVEVWNYKDVYLQAVQNKRRNRIESYSAIATVESGKIVFMESSNKKLSLLKGDFVLARIDNKDKHGDRFWEKALIKDSVWVVSLKDGVCHLLPATSENKFWFSPDGKWLVYFDASKGCRYYGYDLHNRTLKSISANVTENQLNINGIDGNSGGTKDGNLAAWIEGSTYILVYDSYDIWKFDLSGRQPAVNITNGFGQGTRTVLNLFTSDHYSSEVPIIKANESLILRAFNTETKQSGFYQKSGLNAGSPTELYIGDYFMNFITGCHDGNLSNSGIAPMKAQKSGKWIVQRQSTNDAPNYYETRDFKNFRRLTNLQPQAQYRWLTQELHSFKHLDGATGQGILYKPEGFDPTKRYPVLVAFYGQFSNNMNQFRAPDYIDQSMATGKSPAWFLSNGFLVFTPDIAVTPLKYGPKSFSVIEGAANYLGQLPYVDVNKLGFASHSWSSQLGAYLFTHSTTFNAAAITEGLSYGNVISMALSMKDGESKLETVELERNSGNLWENKIAWLDQTTVLNADRGSAALLLLCNKESSVEYQDQTMQFFMAMRRLNKAAWWLKYENGEHSLRDLKERKDYTIRYTQFFDHYLKNAPAPQWMTQGIPYKLKGIESRYELDPQGACNSANGEPCTICQAWNAQYKKNPEMFEKAIKDWELDKEIAEVLQQAQDKRRKELDKQGAIQTKQVMEMLRK